MGANATCVAATVLRTEPPAGKAEILPMFRSWLARMDRPALATSIAILVLTATFGTIIWQEHRHKVFETRESAIHRMNLVAELAVLALAPIVADGAPTAEHLRRLAAILPSVSLTEGRRLLLADAQGDIVASEPPGLDPANLSDLVASGPSAALPDSVQVVGTPAGKVIATVRTIGQTHIALVQPLAAIRGAAQSTHPWVLGSLGGALFVLAGLAVLCGLTTHRRRCSPEAVEAARVRKRLESALARGRCGLWDWDVSKGRIFWSPSLYEILGYQPCDSLTVGEVKALLHPDDRAISTIETKIADPACSHIEQDFRVRTADGRLDLDQGARRHRARGPSRPCPPRGNRGRRDGRARSRRARHRG